MADHSNNKNDTSSEKKHSKKDSRSTSADEMVATATAETATADEATADDELRQLLATNFLEYASYVIKDRAIPDVDDGLKPVQRRILHSLHVMDDGRFHKVANVIGHTMQYHPHGDASIGSALVVLANKEYFIDRQGNFGNILTGDPASAARYIECRLTPLARDVLFNREITEFVESYDGRNQEPVRLPAKIPSLLLLGAEGIAVGMATRILPHNFQELLQAQIAILRNQPFRVFPDFPQGAIMDVSEYDEGRGRIILRAQIEIASDKRLLIREIPASTTTESLMASIEEAAKRNKIKIAAINDYTAENVEIEILLPRGVHAQEAIRQLYAYTDCEIAISSNIIVIRDNLPVEMTVPDILKRNTDKLLQYLKRELEILLDKLQERFHEKTLAQIFIENRIYKRIEESETYENVVAEVDAGLEPFKDRLKREVTPEDIDKLLQIQIRRISRFDINRNQQELEKIVADMAETKHHLKHLVDYAVGTVEGLLEKYGGMFPRRTRIADLEQVDAREVALRNLKVGHDRTGQFVGTEVKNSNRNETPLQCSEFDRLVLMRNDGVFKVIPVPEKEFVGPVKLLLRADKQQIYSMIYRDRKTNAYYAKRFRIDSYIMGREYAALPKNCIIEGFYTNHNVVVRLKLVPNKRRQVSEVTIAFAEIELRSARARGFKVTGYPVESMTVVDRGKPTPDGDEDVGGEDAGGKPETPPDGGAGTPPSGGDGAPPDSGDGASSDSGDGTPPSGGDGASSEMDGNAGKEPAPEEASASAAGGAVSAPAAPGDTGEEARRIAEEWQRRTTAAAQSGKASDKRPRSASASAAKETSARRSNKAKAAQDTTPVSARRPARPGEEEKKAEKKTGDGKEEKPGKLATSVRRLIDEETPFFLE